MDFIPRTREKVIVRRAGNDEDKQGNLEEASRDVRVKVTVMNSEDISLNKVGVKLSKDISEGDEVNNIETNTCLSQYSKLKTSIYNYLLITVIINK